jgi:hypothetical protein
MSSQWTNRFKSKFALLLALLAVPFMLTSCSSEKMSAEEAAVEPCATFEKMTDSMTAQDRASVMSFAGEASAQFDDVASLDPQFGKFAQYLKEVSETGSTGDPFGTYSDLLFYCIPINTPE